MHACVQTYESTIGASPAPTLAPILWELWGPCEAEEEVDQQCGIVPPPPREEEPVPGGIELKRRKQADATAEDVKV